MLTPELAKSLLEKNTQNRHVADSVVATYKRDMLAGRWTETNDAIVIGEDGVLYNGQHRCWAVYESGVSIPSTFMWGMPREARMNLDVGRKRSAADNHEMLTGDANSRRLFETANAIRVLVTREFSASPGEKEQFLERHRTGIDWSVQAFKSNVRSGVGSAPVRAALAFAYETDPATVQAFAQRLLTGVGEFTDGDPVLTLRSAIDSMRGGSTRSNDRRGLSVKTLRAVLAFMRGEKLKALYATEDAVVYFGRKFGYELKGSTESLVLLRRGKPKKASAT